MTDNEIIKALENEIRSAEYVDSDYCDGVDLTLIKSAVALINCQKAEIERLKECPKCIYEYDGNTTEYCVQGPCSSFKTVEQIKSEAIKEFAEKLNAKCDGMIKDKWNSNVAPISWAEAYSDFKDDIDNLVKEMIYEQKSEVK